MSAAVGRKIRHDLVPLFERSGTREQQANAAGRALVIAIDSLRSSSVGIVVEQRADSRPESHPTQAALDFAWTAVHLVYPDREWEEPVSSVGRAAVRAAVRAKLDPPVRFASAQAAGKELALAIVLHDRLPLDVYDSLLAPWVAAIPALAEHHAGVGSNPVTQEEIDMATATRDKAQRRTNPKPAPQPTSKAAAKPEAPRARATSPEREAMDAKVRDFLQQHPKETWGPWAIVQALKLVPEGMGLKDREASKAFDAVRNAGVRLADAGVVTLVSSKPFKFQWAGKGGKRPAPATASEATTQAAEGQREGGKPQATRDAQAKPRSRRQKPENGVAAIDAATQGSPGRSDSQPMPTPGAPNGVDQPDAPAPAPEPEPSPEPEGGVVMSVVPELSERDDSDPFEIDPESTEHEAEPPTE